MTDGTLFAVLSICLMLVFLGVMVGNLRARMERVERKLAEHDGEAR